jgi:hypothetical protein
VRTSYGSFLPRFYDQTLGAVQERISEWLGVPVVFQEDMQVLRYGQGQEYKPHFDGFGRMATILIYLTGRSYDCFHHCMQLRALRCAKRRLSTGRPGRLRISMSTMAENEAFAGSSWELI